MKMESTSAEVLFFFMLDFAAQLWYNHRATNKPAR